MIFQVHNPKTFHLLSNPNRSQRPSQLPPATMSADTAPTSLSTEPAFTAAATHDLRVPSLNPLHIDAYSEIAKVASTSSSAPIIAPTAEAPFKPQGQISFQLALKYQICTPYARHPLKSIPRRSINSYTPTPFNMYEVLHYMDTLTQINPHFHNENLACHPIISRIYYGELFILQTLRCMQYAGILSLDNDPEVITLLKMYPPDSLSIAGPLVPIFRALSTSKPSDPSYNMVTPAYTHSIHDRAQLLAPFDDAGFLATPNIPLLLALANRFNLDFEPDLPDMTSPDFFNAANHNEIIDFEFPAEAWTAHMRRILLSPGLIRTPETDDQIDQQFQDYMQNLRLPNPYPQDIFQDIINFSYVTEPYCFKQVTEIMTVYNAQFKEASTLGAVALSGSTAGLIKTTMPLLSSPTAAQNSVATIDMFPNVFPFKYVYSHSTIEPDIPQIQQMQSKYASINATMPNQALAFWNRVNAVVPKERIVLEFIKYIHSIYEI